MTYRISDPVIGNQPIADNSTVKNHPLGTVCRAISDTYGEGEFIYLLGVASTVVGLMVRYNATTYQTTLLASATNLGVPIAVAMSACDAGQYGWYQIGGNAVIKKTAVAVTPGVAVFLSATTGRIKVVASNGRGIIGAKSANLTTVSAGVSSVVVTINRPAMQISVAAA
jgi:hypothetical protein